MFIFPPAFSLGNPSALLFIIDILVPSGCQISYFFDVLTKEKPFSNPRAPCCSTNAVQCFPLLILKSHGPIDRSQTFIIISPVDPSQPFCTPFFSCSLGSDLLSWGSNTDWSVTVAQPSLCCLSHRFKSFTETKLTSACIPWKTHLSFKPMKLLIAFISFWDI